MRRATDRAGGPIPQRGGEDPRLGGKIEPVKPQGRCCGVFVYGLCRFPLFPQPDVCGGFRREGGGRFLQILVLGLKPECLLMRGPVPLKLKRRGIQCPVRLLHLPQHPVDFSFLHAGFFPVLAERLKSRFHPSGVLPVGFEALIYRQ